MRHYRCFEFPFFGARYPDAGCVGGNLLDLDKCDDSGNLYDTGEYNPCPVCRTEDYVNNLIGNEVGIGKILGHMNFIVNRYGIKQ